MREESRSITLKSAPTTKRRPHPPFQRSAIFARCSTRAVSTTSCCGTACLWPTIGCSSTSEPGSVFWKALPTTAMPWNEAGRILTRGRSSTCSRPIAGMSLTGSFRQKCSTPRVFSWDRRRASPWVTQTRIWRFPTCRAWPRFRIRGQALPVRHQPASGRGHPGARGSGRIRKEDIGQGLDPYRALTGVPAMSLRIVPPGTA